MADEWGEGGGDRYFDKEDRLRAGGIIMTRLIISCVIVLGLVCPVVLGKTEAKPAVETVKPTIEPARPTVEIVKPVKLTTKTVKISEAGEILTVTVKSVSGSAEVREGPDKSWRAIKGGDIYQEGAEIRTGFRAKVELAFADNSKMIISRGSHFRVDKFRRSGTKVITRSHLAYGKINAGVEKGPAFSDYKISTPLGTLGVNGTRGIRLEVDPGRWYARICLRYDGNIGWNMGLGSDANVDPGGCTDQYGTRQDKGMNGSNNVNLLDRFGSTGSENDQGNGNGNQGGGGQDGGPSGGNKGGGSSPYDHHYGGRGEQ